MCAAAALVVVVFVVVLHSDLPLGQRQLISDVGLLGGGLVGALSCAARSTATTGRRQRAWRFFTGAMGAAALGNFWILVAHATGGGVRSSTPGNVLFLLALLLGITGLAAFPSVPRRGTDFARMLIDGIIIGAAMISITNDTVFTELLSDERDPLRQIVLLLPGLLDVAVLTLVVLLIVRIRRSDRPALALLSVGLTLYAVSDLTRSVLEARNAFQFGGVVDVGWIAGYLLVALAGRKPTGTPQADLSESRDTSPAAGTLVIFGLVLTAAVFSMNGVNLNSFNPAAAGLWLILVLAVAARQILLIVDNDRLRHDLERLVDERTRALRQATRRSELLLTSVGEGIYGVDQAGAVTFVNPAGADALGYRPAQLIGRDAHATFHGVDPDGVPFPRESCYVMEAITDGSVTSAEGDVYLRSTGRAFPVEVTATPIASDDQVTGAVVVFRDVTQRQEVDRLKNEFVSMVSHELRTPLTSIRGSLGLLAGGALGPLPARAQRMVELAQESGARLTRLINDILDLERIETGNLPMEIREHFAEELIVAATAQLAVLAAAAEVQVRVPEASGVVVADGDRAVQTLINLLDNAIKFSPRRGLVEVSSHVVDRHVEFRISDQGRGVPEDKIERIFSRFEQVDSSDARDKGGSGLGLAISRSVVERLGGRIWAESTEGAGATFRFTLPQADRAPADVPADDLTSSVGRSPIARPAKPTTRVNPPQPAEAAH